jgi:hypothetical protein
MGNRERRTNARWLAAAILAAAVVTAVPDGASAQYGYGYEAAGTYIEDQLDNITVKAGAGYAFV